MRSAGNKSSPRSCLSSKDWSRSSTALDKTLIMNANYASTLIRSNNSDHFLGVKKMIGDAVAGVFAGCLGLAAKTTPINCA